MGLYINDKEHPEVYKNNQQLTTSNQSYTKQDFLTELIKDQQDANASLKKALEELRTSFKEKEIVQTKQWDQIGTELSDIRQGNLKHEELENQLLQWLKLLDDKQVNLQTLLENEFLQKKEIIEQINSLGDSNQVIAERLEQQETIAQRLSLQMEEQLELQKEVSAQQGDFQADVLKRLDKQEALTEKISRQLTHIRSILFERTNHLASKIEEGYQLTSSYVYKLMTGSDHPLTFFLYNQKKEENQHHSD